MKKYCITLLSLLVLVIELCAQNIYTVPILDETLSQQKIPTNPYYGYGISQTIYLNTDINMSGTITRISYKIDPIHYSFNRNVTIFLAETSKSSFSSELDYVDPSIFSQVYSGTISYESNKQWIHIELDTPFDYTGVGNLVVGFLDNTGFYRTSINYASASVSEQRGLYKNDDNIISFTAPQFESTTNTIPIVKLKILSNDDYCESIEEMNVNVLTDTSAKIEWNDIPSAASYVLEYKSGIDESWSVANSVILTDSFYTINNLLPETLYDVRVKNICDDDWCYSQFETFMTPVNLPYQTSFASNEDRAWKLINDDNNSWVIDSIENSVYDNALFVSSNGETPSYDTSHASNIYAEKIFNLGSEPNIHIEFDFIAGGEEFYDGMKVYFVPVELDVTSSAINLYPYTLNLNVITASSPSTISLTQGYSLHATTDVTNFAPNGLGKLVFYWKNDEAVGLQPGLIISNILVGTNTCTTPMIEVDNNITTSSVVMNITGNSNIYTLHYRKRGDIMWTTEMFTQETITLDNLEPSTRYEYKIVGNCLNTVSNTTVGYFETACADVFQDNVFPYREDFESYIANTTLYSEKILPQCWSKGNGYQSVGLTHAINTVSGVTSLYIYENTVSLPKFERNISDLSISFYAKPSNVNYASILYVGYMTDPSDTSTFVSVESIDVGFQQNVFLPHVVSFQGVTIPDNAVVSFRKHDVIGIYIDDVVLDLASTCAAPVNLSSGRVTSSSVLLSWQENQEGIYKLYYKTDSQSQYSTKENITLTNGEYLLTELEPNTTYNWYVSSICSDGTENAYNVIKTFTTLCDTLPVSVLPIEENFEEDVFPDCWITTGSASIMDQYWTSYNNGTTISLPLVDTEISNLFLAFDVKKFNENISSVQVGYMTDPLDTNTFLPIQVISSDYLERNSYRRFVIPFNNVPDLGQSVYVSIRFFNNIFHVDNIVLDTIPNCIEPSMLQVDNITPTTVDLSWLTLSSNNIVYYRVLGEETYSDTIVTLSATGVFTLDNLLEGTTYEWYVVSVCEDGTQISTSNLNNTFTTDIYETTLPYFTDFSVGSDRVWKLNNTRDVYWTIGYCGSYNANQDVLFVTTDGINARSNASDLEYIVTAEKVFNLEDSKYVHIEFDAKVGGEPHRAYMKVFLAPVTENYSSGTSTLPDYAKSNTSEYALDFSQYGELSVSPDYVYTNQVYYFCQTASMEHFSFDLPKPTQDNLVKLVFLWVSGVYTETYPPSDVTSLILDNIFVEGYPCYDVQDTIEATICEGEIYQFDQIEYNESGIYDLYYETYEGCDSTITLILDVLETQNIVDTLTLNENEPCEWYGTTYTQAGEYIINLVSENGCPYTATLVLCDGVGIENADNAISLALYPNPTTSNATLNVEGLNEEAMVVVTDIQGRTIQSNKLAQGQTVINISIENLASGVYYVRVITSNATRTEKLIKK